MDGRDKEHLVFFVSFFPVANVLRNDEGKSSRNAF